MECLVLKCDNSFFIAWKSFSGRYYFCVTIDLEKAFDLAWHKCILYKMKQLGHHGNVLKFVEDFLKGRSVQVRVRAAMSSTYFLENGPPLASVLSPLLLLIMINGLESSTGVKLALFAVDSSMW